MRMKRLLSLLLALVLLCALMPMDLTVHAEDAVEDAAVDVEIGEPVEIQTPGASDQIMLLAETGELQHPSKEEIAAKWATVTSAASLYQTEPTVASPYAAGALTEDFLESGITYLNYVRFVAGLPEVTLDDTLNEDAQYGAVLLAAVDYLSHYPEQPDDMDDDFYARGYAATTSSNISARWGYSPLTCLKGAVEGCMNDNGSLGNLTTVGHRRWLLNPTLGKVGFGYAESDTEWSYIVTKVFDRSGAGCDYDFISWPVSGNQPTNLFDAQNPWSVTLNTAVFKSVSADSVTVMVTRESDGTTWTFDGSTGEPNIDDSDYYNPYIAPYLTVNTQWYGVPNCIIFHPGTDNVDSYEGVYSVKITGIYYTDGTEAELSYKVDFFDVDSVCTGHNYEAVVTKPTCTGQGYTTHTCTNCGDSYVDNYTEATGHSYEAVVTGPTCTEQGYTTHTCTTCGDSYVDNYTEATGHSYEAVVTAPTCTAQGYTTHTCTTCGSSYKDTYTDALGHTYEDGSCIRCGTQDSNVLLGDVNGDEEIDLLDALLIIAYYNETSDLTADQFTAADVNGDSEVDMSDANLIIQYYNELITSFPVEE